MKRISIVFLMLIVMISMSGCGNSAIVGRADLSVNMTPRMISVTDQMTTSEMIATVTPAVVGISAASSTYESVGSGVAVAENGYILTNYHVVEGAKNITVYFANKTSTSAKLVWDDSAVDIAIIKTDMNMPYLKMGSSEELRPGDEMIAIGTPLTLQFKHTATKGIVSALNRTVEIANTDGTYSYLQNLIQHDASINPGNSGGPLISAKGEVVGINTLKVSEAEGIGFAIPIEIVKPVISKLTEKGSFNKPYIGVYGFDASIAQFYGRTFEEDGVYLLNVDENGPGKKAGLIEGDIITFIGENEIESMLDLRTVVYNYEAGNSVTVKFKRQGKDMTTKMTFSAR